MQEFLTVRWIGMPHKLSSHQVNLLLFENGYVNRNRVPTPEAKGHYERYQLDCGLYGYKWDKQFVASLIEQAQPKPVTEKKSKKKET